MTRGALAAVRLAALWAAFGCGDDAPAATWDTDASSPDARVGADAGPASGGYAPLEPQIPWLAAGAPPVAPPLLTPCPAGWTERAEADAPSWCDPFPEGAPSRCERSDEAHFPAEPGCRAVGRACPAGDWADDLPASGVIYVAPRFLPVANGSRAQPFGSIRAAMLAARSGSIVALAKGRYEERLVVREGVIVRGACAAETVIASPDPVAIVPDGRGCEVHDVSTVGAIGAGAQAVGSDRELTLRGVVLDATSGTGIAVAERASVIAIDTIVRATRPSDDGSGFGQAIAAQLGARVQLERVALLDNRQAAVAAFDEGTSVVLRDVLVEGTRQQGPAAAALQAEQGADLDAERVTLEHDEHVGLDVGGEGSRARCLDCVVRGTFGDPASMLSHAAVRVRDGAAATLERVRIVDARAIAVAVAGASRLELRDVALSGPPADATGAGVGLEVQSGSVVEADRLSIARANRHAVIVFDPASSVALRDLEVRATRADAEGRYGRAIEVRLEGRVSVERGRLLDSRDGAVVAADLGTLRLTDVAIRGVEPDPVDGMLGRGLVVQERAASELSRVLVEDAHDVGLAVLDGAAVTATDVLVRRIESRPADGRAGYGLVAQGAAVVMLERVRVGPSRGAGLVASGAGTMLAGRDVAVGPTLAPACADSCPDEAGGLAVVALLEGALQLDGFASSDAALCGVSVMLDGQLDLSRGSVRGAPVGACVQLDGYDLARLSHDVIYEDNEVNLQATSYPPPAAVGSLASSGPEP